MRAGWLIVLGACGHTTPEPPVPSPPGPRDAAIDAAIDAAPDAPLDAAPLEPSLSCDGTMRAKGWLRVRVDPITLRGEIERVTAGAALGRHLKVIARRDGDTATLIFDGYLPRDQTSIRGRRAPLPPGEKLVRGTSIVGRLVAVPPGTTRFYVDHEVDWVTGAELVVRDGYTTCRPQ